MKARASLEPVHEETLENCPESLARQMTLRCPAAALIQVAPACDGTARHHRTAHPLVTTAHPPRHEALGTREWPASMAAVHCCTAARRPRSTLGLRWKSTMPFFSWYTSVNRGVAVTGDAVPGHGSTTVEPAVDVVGVVQEPLLEHLLVEAGAVEAGGLGNLDVPHERLAARGGEDAFGVGALVQRVGQRAADTVVLPLL
jgi:hypothetical protein